MLVVALAAATIVVVAFLSPPATSRQKSLILDANVVGTPAAQVVVNASDIPDAGVLLHMRVSEAATFSNFYVLIRRDGVVLNQLVGRRPVRSSTAAVEIPKHTLTKSGHYQIMLFPKNSRTAIADYVFLVKVGD